MAEECFARVTILGENDTPEIWGPLLRLEVTYSRADDEDAVGSKQLACLAPLWEHFPKLTLTGFIDADTESRAVQIVIRPHAPPA
jgi:hypothetical protein